MNQLTAEMRANIDQTGAGLRDRFANMSPETKSNLAITYIGQMESSDPFVALTAALALYTLADMIASNAELQEASK